MEQGILKSFVAKNDASGVQETYVGDKGTNYKFTVVLDNKGIITTGTAMSNKTQPSWKIGDEYSYEKTVSGASGQYINIKSLKNLTNPFTPGGGSKPNPAFCIQKCYEAAVEVTLQFFKKNPTNYNSTNETALLNAIWQHVLVGDESARWMNISGLRLAVLKMEVDTDVSKHTSKWFLETARDITEQMKASVKQQVDIDKNNEGK